MQKNKNKNKNKKHRHLKITKLIKGISIVMVTYAAAVVTYAPIKTLLALACGYFYGFYFGYTLLCLCLFVIKI